MAEHYTLDTVEVSAWCRKCKKNTMHHVGGRRLGSCQECIKNLEAEAKQPKPAPRAKQDSLF